MSSLLAHTPFIRHPLSAALRELNQLELTQLAQSIGLYGQLHKVVLFEGMVLDGWNRILACALIGCDPNTRELADDEAPLGVVLANNFDRRESPKYERALGIVNLYYLINNLSSRSDSTVRHGESSAAPPHWTKGKSWTPTKAELAVRAGVCKRTIQDMMRLRAHGEQRLIDAVREGRVPVEESLQWLGYDIDGQYNALDAYIVFAAKRDEQRREKQKQDAAQRKERKSTAVPQRADAPIKTDVGSVLASKFDPPNASSASRHLFETAVSKMQECCNAIESATELDRSTDECRRLTDSCRRFLASFEDRALGFTSCPQT